MTQKISKKNQLKKLNQVVDDRTFGLKNKNKSSKVQKFIQQVEVGVKNSNNANKPKAKATGLDDETRMLLEEGMNAGKKKKAEDVKASSAAVAEEESSSSSSESDSDEEELIVPPPAIIVTHEETAIEGTEIFREKTLEDIIEEQRAKLAAEGKVGTPVTAETFALWRTAKLAKRQAEVEARVKAEQSKKKGGKGLSVLSGKELFNFNSSLFVDDDCADNEKDNDLYAEARKQREDAEEALARIAADNAKKEQQRLFEERKLENDIKIRAEKRRRKKAAASTDTFALDGVVFRELVFHITEKEDFTPFAIDCDGSDYVALVHAAAETEKQAGRDEGLKSNNEVVDENDEDDCDEEEAGGGLDVNEDLFGGDDDDVEDLDDEEKEVNDA